MKKNKTILSILLLGLMLQTCTCFSASWISFSPDDEEIIESASGIMKKEMDLFWLNAPDLLRTEIYKLIIICGILGIATYLYKKLTPTAVQDVFDQNNNHSNALPVLYKKNTPQELIEQEKIEGDIDLPEVMEDNLQMARTTRENKKLKQHNIILAGPPGSGKSTAAKFYAKKLDEILINKEVVVYTIDPANLISKYWGGTTENISKLARDVENTAQSSLVKKLYTMAFNQTLGRIKGETRENKFVILILDEFEALFVGQGGEQNHGLAASATMKNLISNTFDPNENIIFIATTNHLGQIPEELVDRADFEYVPEPDEERIEKILKSVIKSAYKEIYNKPIENFDEYINTQIIEENNETNKTIISELVEKTKGSGIRTLKKAIRATFVKVKTNGEDKPKIEDYFRIIQKIKEIQKIKNHLRKRNPKEVDRLPQNFNSIESTETVINANFKQQLENRKDESNQYDKAIKNIIRKHVIKEQKETLLQKKKALQNRQTLTLLQKTEQLIKDGKLKRKKNIISNEI